jgi:hypothetical protein
LKKVERIGRFRREKGVAQLSAFYEVTSRVVGTLISLQQCRSRSNPATMKFRMSRILRFWVDVEYEAVKDQFDGLTKSELIAQILHEFEEAGDAMRCLNTRGEIAWKATPRMLTRLADAEREARDDLADWP